MEIHADSETSTADLRTSADERDAGYRFESLETLPLDTPMGSRYREYKSYDADAYEAEKEYKRRLKDIPQAPARKRRTKDYVGKSNYSAKSPCYGLPYELRDICPKQEGFIEPLSCYITRSDISKR